MATKTYVNISIIIAIIAFLARLIEYVETSIFTIAMINLAIAIVLDFVIHGFFEEYLPTIKTKTGKIVAGIFLAILFLGILLNIFKII